MCKIQPQKPGPTQTPCAPPVRELWVACSATQELPSFGVRFLHLKLIWFLRHLLPTRCWFVWGWCVSTLEQRSWRKCMGGLETGPSRRHRIQPAEGPVLDPRAKETCFKKGQKVDPLEIKSGPLLVIQLRLDFSMSSRLRQQEFSSIWYLMSTFGRLSLWPTKEVLWLLYPKDLVLHQLVIFEESCCSHLSQSESMHCFDSALSNSSRGLDPRDRSEGLSTNRSDLLRKPCEHSAGLHSTRDSALEYYLWTCPMRFID